VAVAWPLELELLELLELLQPNETPGAKQQHQPSMGFSEQYRV
jgi:hypothetical protein